MNLPDYFKGVSDPRVIGRIRHKLIDIIGIAIISVIAECDEWQDVTDWARSKQDDLKKYFELPNGIPSHDTFERVFALINPQEFEQCFIQWVESIFGSKHRFVHIDGKSLTGSRDVTHGKKMLHLVHAWASEQNILLGQVKTEEKSNEITAIPELIALLDLAGSIVTIDAMGCQQEIAKNIIDAEAEYILAVKDNQKSLHNQIQTAFSHQTIESTNTTEEKSHGRIETRTCRIITNLELAEETCKWKSSQSIVEIERIRWIKGKETKEISHYISSLKRDAAFMNQAVRAHWSVENPLHWSLDVTFREDASRKRKGNQAQNFAILRRIALNVVRTYKGDNRSIRRRRKMASYEFTYLKDVLKI